MSGAGRVCALQTTGNALGAAESPGRQTHRPEGPDTRRHRTRSIRAERTVAGWSLPLAYTGAPVAAGGQGRVKLNVLPAPTVLSTQMRPPCASTSPFVM